MFSINLGLPKYSDFILSADFRGDAAMPYAGWRSPAAYDRTKGLETGGWAWEWLRRNPNYQRDHRGLTYARPDPRLITMFRTTWGLSFCG
jgi:Family of unknown function (DUF6499)